MDHKKQKLDKDILLRREATNPLVTKLNDLVDQINLAANEYDELHTIIKSREEWLEHPKKAAGEFLHDLLVPKGEYAYDVVQMLIDAFPEAMLYKNEDGNIPIEAASRHGDGERYVLLLATEAAQHKILPDTRGGLLLPCPRVPHHNILQRIVNVHYLPTNGCYHEGNMYVLMDLRSAGLLLDQDFLQYNLIGVASWKPCLRHLDYLLDIYPKALSMPQPDSGDFPIHPSNFFHPQCVEAFEKLLTAGMAHYPENLGYLFQPNTKGEMPITQAIDKYGKDETFQVIQNAIPSTEHHLILHQVFQHRCTPDLCEEFVHRYPNAVSVKDSQGRSLLHVTMSIGLKLSDSTLVTICNEQCIAEKDPVTGLYPFMLAAAASGNDKTTVYQLLRFYPDVISWCVSFDQERWDG